MKHLIDACTFLFQIWLYVPPQPPVLYLLSVSVAVPTLLCRVQFTLFLLNSHRLLAICIDDGKRGDGGGGG